MIRTLTRTKKLIPIITLSNPTYKSYASPAYLLNKQRVFYQFASQEQRLPKNKQEAWMMQEQKRIKQNPFQSEDGQTYSTLNKWAALAFFVVLGGLVYMVTYAEKKSDQNLKLFQDESITGLRQVKQQQSRFGGDWTLLDTQGQPFSSSNLEGSYYLVYFGYTNSPDACPSALYYLSTVYRVIRNIPQGAYLKFKVVFISIDPERDTPSKVKEFLSHFNKNIIGVTASGPHDIELYELMKKFKIQGKKVYPNPQNTQKYEMDYNTRVFLMDSQNKYMWHIDSDLTEQQAAKAIVSKIVSKEHMKEKQMQQAGL